MSDNDNAPPDTDAIHLENQYLKRTGELASRERICVQEKVFTAFCAEPQEDTDRHEMHGHATLPLETAVFYATINTKQTTPFLTDLHRRFNEIECNLDQAIWDGNDVQLQACKNNFIEFLRTHVTPSTDDALRFTRQFIDARKTLASQCRAPEGLQP